MKEEPPTIDHDPNEFGRPVQLLAVIVEIVVAAVLFWLFFMPIKNYVQEAVRPSVRAVLDALDLE